MSQRSDQEIQDRIHHFVELLATLEISGSDSHRAYSSMRGELLGMLWVVTDVKSILALDIAGDGLIAARLDELEREREVKS